jgi:hypothetical protein
MRRWLTTLLLLLLPGLALAQITPALNWQPGANEYVVSGTMIAGKDGAKTAFEANAAYMHFTTKHTEIGVATNVFRSATGASAFTAGPRYEYNLPTLKWGNFFVGGDGTAMLVGNDPTTYAAIGRVGYKYHVRQSSAFRVEFNIARPVGANAPDTGNAVSAAIGYSFAAPATPVTNP